MAQLIDPRQYFLNIIAKSRLASAQQTGVQLQMDIAKGRYEDLDISEVVFGEEQFDQETGEWKVDIACKGRSYMLEGVKYRSGTLAPMIKANAVEAAGELLEITTPGFYLFNDQLYLLAHKTMEVSELLAWTGYEITEKHYSVVEHEQRDEVTKADAEIDVEYSFLKGKLFVTYIDSIPSTQAIDLDTVGMDHDIARLEETQLEHKVETNGEEQPVTEEVVQDEVVSEEPVTETDTSVAEAELVQEEEVQAPVQQVQENRKGNKRR
ncbi:hypothetical protein PQC65_gp228 [Aeromonas phage pAEv1810]|uniref:hypothetical protein n=1 Tax=Aeromonas phage pAEv1810 TaxID=2908744 RepID=UPI0023298CFF|nr:hypothetical protein PQC65_gp228 [Aeromonas phage pAEv1810]UIS25166.1 hypothetical protein pAEv1810_228 [Aeromonas phage pAEv1810]